MPAVRWSALVLQIAFAVLATIATARADVTYRYTGQPFTAATPPFTTAQSVTLAFVLSDAITPDTQFNGLLNPPDFSVSDGVNTFLRATSGMQVQQFLVHVDASGNVDSWAIDILVTGVGEIKTSFQDGVAADIGTDLAASGSPSGSNSCDATTCGTAPSFGAWTEISTFPQQCGNSAVGCNLSGANFAGAFLLGVNFANATLRAANFAGADLNGATLTNADGPQVNFSGADLIGANLAGANLSNARLIGASLIGADLLKVVATGADFSGADLTRANLRGANLAGASLAGATLTDANLDKANLTGADLTDANLTDMSVTGLKIGGAIWANTICPDGSNSDADKGTCAHNLSIRHTRKK
jgi:uncharacterized protein YjbI with pentapeptide repeats